MYRLKSDGQGSLVDGKAFDMNVQVVINSKSHDPAKADSSCVGTVHRLAVHFELNLFRVSFGVDLQQIRGLSCRVHLLDR
jgi:hypothetical protein